GELGLVRMYSGSPLATMMLLLSRLLPFLLVAPVAGVLVDRRSRKRIMLTADLCQALVALGYLAVRSPSKLWIVYCCGAAMSSLSIMFEAAKNAALPNLVTPNQMLTANVMVYSTRFLQLTLGAALGGMTAARFGYSAAFIVNSISFVCSAACVKRINAREMRKDDSGSPEAPASLLAVEHEYDRADSGYRPTDLLDTVPAPAREAQAANGFDQTPRRSALRRTFSDLRDGMAYIWAHPFVRALILANIGWATGGGMINLLYDRLGGHIFVHGAGDRGDWSVATLYTAAGAGLCIGMGLARHVGDRLTRRLPAGLFIGAALLAYGLVFALAGVTKSLYPMALCIGASRVILGLEFGVHETFMMRVLPDDFRGRVFTTDRSLELAMVTLSMMAAGWLLTRLDPRTVMVVSGLLSATPGLLWLLAMKISRFSVPERALTGGEEACTAAS
ncbi:MAG TPA: MFS transporter, partial [Blastocatellia bacterium]|nr:MFS transporter [Blastocatellia bacterium]